MGRGLVLIFFLFAGTSQAAAEVYSVGADLWARPRTGPSVATMPPVANAMDELLAHPNSALVIRYPGGDEGVLWAQELRAWLISLGLESDRIEMQPGGPRIDSLELQVRARDGRTQ